MDLSQLLEQKRRKQAKRKAQALGHESAQTMNNDEKSEFPTKKMDLGEKSGENAQKQTEIRDNSSEIQDKQGILVSKGMESIKNEEKPLKGLIPTKNDPEPIKNDSEPTKSNISTKKNLHLAPGHIPKDTEQNSEVSGSVPGSSNSEEAKEAKKQLYQAYLDREKEVPLRIEVSDISERNLVKLQLQTRKFLKDILGQWTENEQNSVVAVFQPEKKSILTETKKDIVKLLYKLRSGKLSEEMVISLSTIVHYIQEADLLKANEAYLKLSIGNVAWPIGVRDVGIHARAADAKIAGDDKSQLANIMKSESTRRWLIAVKRVLNYCGELLRFT